MTSQVHKKSNNRNYIPYLMVIFRQKWRMFLFLILIGGAVATLVIYLRGPIYQAKASFLSDSKVVLAQVERLDSRDVLLKAIQRLDFVEIEYYNRKGIRGEFNYYDQSPFTLDITSFPDHFKEKEMKIVFLEEGGFHFSFGEFGKEYEAIGYPGKLVELGSISFILNITRFWSNRYINNPVFFRVHAIEKLATDFRKRLRIVHLLNRKNRIAVSYTDRNRRRALDIMNAITEVALEDWEAANHGRMEIHFRRIHDRMEIIYKELKDNTDLSSFIAESDAKLSGLKIDSLLVEAKYIAEKAEILEKRRVFFERNGTLAYEKEGFLKKSAEMALNDNTLLLKLLNIRKSISFEEKNVNAKLRQVNLQIATEIRRVQIEDSIALIQLDHDKAAVELLLVTNLNLRRAYIRKIFKTRKEIGLPILQWEEYLNLFSEHNDIAVQFSEDQNYFGKLESPYVIIISHRFEQAKRIFTGAFAGGILGILIMLFIAFNASRISSTAQLTMMTGFPVIAEIQREKIDLESAARKLRVALEMQRGENEKVVSIGCESKMDLQSDFIHVLIEKYSQMGLNVHHLDARLPKSDAENGKIKLANWMLSEKVGQEIKDGLGTHDLVFQDLAPFGEFPEAWLQTRHAKHLIYLVKKGEIRFSDLQALEKEIAVMNLQVYFVFVS